MKFLINFIIDRFETSSFTLRRYEIYKNLIAITSLLLSTEITIVISLIFKSLTSDSALAIANWEKLKMYEFTFILIS